MAESINVSKIVALQQQIIKEEINKLNNRLIQQEESKIDMEEWSALGEFTIQKKPKFNTLKENKKILKKREKTFKKIEKADEAAAKFQKKNYELNKNDLLLLRNSIHDSDTKESILKKVLEFFKDPSLADEALDFLIETTEKELQQKVIGAKELLREKLEREIKAGRNIQTDAQNYSKTGIGTPTSLRDLYREITSKARPIDILFNELSKKFDFEKLKTVFKFLFHALGSDMKSKGPSIERAFLIKLIDDTKSLQAILGLYYFFRSRMGLINSLFAKNNLSLPNSINFENLAKQFMSLISARYITTDSIHRIASILKVADIIIAQIIVITQMKDAIRRTSPRLYKSSKKREDILEAFLEYLEELEEEEEKEEKEKEKEEKEEEE